MKREDIMMGGSSRKGGETEDMDFRSRAFPECLGRVRRVPRPFCTDLFDPESLKARSVQTGFGRAASLLRFCRKEAFGHFICSNHDP